jgi:hypothetical protein
VTKRGEYPLPIHPGFFGVTGYFPLTICPKGKACLRKEMPMKFVVIFEGNNHVESEETEKAPPLMQNAR